jgi:hypothetical protein
MIIYFRNSGDALFTFAEGMAYFVGGQPAAPAANPSRIYYDIFVAEAC